MKFFTILFVILLIACVLTSCFVGYAPFLGKLSKALIGLTVGAGVIMAAFIIRDFKGKK